MDPVPPLGLNPRQATARPRRRRLGLVTGAVLFGSLVGMLAPSLAPSPDQAAAQVPPDPEPAAAPAGPISPALDDIDLTSAAYDAATARRDELARRLSEAEASRQDAERRLADLAATEAEVSAELDATRAEHQRLTGRVDELVGALEEMAVATYITGRSGVEELADVLDNRVTERGRDKVLVASVSESQATDLGETRELRREVEREITLTEAVLADVRGRIVETTEARDQAIEEGDRLAGELGRAEADVERSRVMAVVQGTDFPLVALDAYHRAAASVPECGLRWWALAGISQVEGRHGTFGGSQLTVAGGTTQRIIGIPLNGAFGTALIGDTDGGALDGDPAFDRAVGPMQFIPSTWARWSADGNGDGIEDPHNLYDASLAATHYLCAGRGGLDTDEGLRPAYFSYNFSGAYVEDVLRWARHYQSSVSDLA